MPLIILLKKKARVLHLIIIKVSSLYFYYDFINKLY